MKEHWKKLTAPIIIITCVILYYILIAAVFLIIDGIPGPVKILGLVIPAGFIGVSIFVLKERINEIRSGEEDDLSKY